MPEHHEPDTGSKSKTYQSIAVYDGSDPAYFKNWHAKVLSHYATWLNGEDRAGHWKQHLVSDGCYLFSLKHPSETRCCFQCPARSSPFSHVA